MFAKTVISALVALQVIATVIASHEPAISYPYAIGASNVTTKTDDYILDNRRQYNATLKHYLAQIDNVKQSLDDQLKVLDKQKVLLLNTLQETNEKIDPLEVLSLPSKFCVQRYHEELPYADTIKANIESCINSARSYSSNIVSTPTSYYNSLNNYYNNDLKRALTACGKSHREPSLNYTLCVTAAIAQTNSYTISNRKNFATAMQSSECSLNSRIDVAVSCTYGYYNAALSSIGAISRLIDDCIYGYIAGNKPQCESQNATVIAGCPHVVYMEVKEGDFQNRTISNPLQGLGKHQNCLELRFV